MIFLNCYPLGEDAVSQDGVRVDRYSAVAKGILRQSGLDRAARVSVGRLAAELGIRLVQEDAYGAAVPAGFYEVRGAVTVWTRPGLQVVRRRDLQARMIAHWHMVRSGLRAETAAKIACRVGAALIAPTGPVRRLWSSSRGRAPEDRLVEASIQLGAPCSTIALRVAEVTRAPVAVVTPKRTIFRGDWSKIPTDGTRCRCDGAHEIATLYAPDRPSHLILLENC